MADLARTDELFFTQTGMDRARVEKIVAEALAGMDDGELFLEWSQSEALALDDGRIKSASFDQSQGFGLRALSRRIGGLCPCLGAVRGGDQARRRRRCARCTRAKAASWRSPRRAPTARFTPTPIRWPRSISRPRPSF